MIVEGVLFGSVDLCLGNTAFMAALAAVTEFASTRQV